MKLEFVTYEDLLKGTNKYGIDMICDLFSEFIDCLETFIDEFSDEFKTLYPHSNFKEHVYLDEDKAIQAVLEALDDLKRLKDFHPVKNPNRIKYASYFAYWWLQRKPIMINSEGLQLSDEEKLRITNFNEFFLVSYMLNELFKRDDIYCCCDDDKIHMHDSEWVLVQDYLFYFLCYRTNSPKTLEAFLRGSILHPVWKRNKDVGLT